MAEHVARQLDQKLREHLGSSRANLFSEATPGLAAAISRPLLCLFDRNFELSVVSKCCVPCSVSHLQCVLPEWCMV